MIHYFKTEKTARVVVEGEVGPQLKQVWLVAHGYGHLASYFVNKMRSLFNEENIVIVPEGLHRYYLNGVNGRVGASWMTKEEREHDIQDYCLYLDKVYETYILSLEGKVSVNAMGFSQGGATICRWAAHTKHKIDNLIIWGSVIPPDMKWESDLDKIKACNWFYVAGNADEYLTKAQQDEQLALLKKHGIHPELIEYEGGHDILNAPLALLTQKCVKKT